MTSPNNCFGCRGYQDKLGVLVAQLGTPEAPTKKALKPYLRQFLSDRRVIELNPFLWWFVLNGFILNTRPKRSARLYSRIWREDGSPLLLITKSQTEKLKKRLNQNGEKIEVIFGMRYGAPSLESKLDELIELGCTRLLLLPMYPQYAAATTASVYDVVFKHILNRRWVPTIKVIEPYFRHSLYIRAVNHSIEEYYKHAPKRPERLVLSYHGIPKEYVEKGDPYCCMCVETTKQMQKEINIPANEIIHTYQSRFGKNPWLTPYTDETIAKLAEEGVKQIAVACPGFVADCLETLDELGNEGAHLFKEKGGEYLGLIPCVNDSEAFIDCLEALVRETSGSWLESVAEQDDRVDVSCPAACNG